MRRTVLGILLLASASTAAAETIQTPILGGTPTKVGDFPAVVGLQVGQGMCTGTLIQPDWILTAAHCIQGLSPASVTAHFGTVNMFSDPGVTRKAVELYAKPGFSQYDLGHNDIGLIKIDRPITDITPVAVNLDPLMAPVGIKVTMVGFGATSVGGGGSVGVQYTVEQTSIQCSSFVGSNTDLLCFNQISGKGKCQGDSGGPSFTMINGTLTQVGVTSFGDQDCAQFGADTRTDAEKGFLLSHIPQLLCEYDSDCGEGKRCFQKKCIKTPFTEGGLGSECTNAADCAEAICANDGENAYCSATCSPTQDNSCPDGLDCIDTGQGTGACWPTDTGCCSSTRKSAPTAFLAMAFLGVALGRKRRRAVA
jgi:hypothetical protein